MQRPATSLWGGSKAVYSHHPEGIYQVYGAINHVVDVQLESGEKLLTPPIVGDSANWNVTTGTEGNTKAATTHVFIRPLRPDLEWKPTF